MQLEQIGLSREREKMLCEKGSEQNLKAHNLDMDKNFKG